MTEQHPNKDLPKEDQNSQTPEGQTDENNNQEGNEENEVTKKLRDQFTQARAREINYATKIAETDKETILSLDPETQKKVIKNIYGLNNIEEVKLLHWEEFYKSKTTESDSSQEDDRLERVEKELKLTKYQQELREIDGEIEKMKLQYPLAFENEEVEQKVRDEIALISNKVDNSERVRRATSFVVSNTENAWKSLRSTGSFSQPKVNVEEQTANKGNEVEDIFRKRFPKKA